MEIIIAKTLKGKSKKKLAYKPKIRGDKVAKD